MGGHDPAPNADFLSALVVAFFIPSGLRNAGSGKFHCSPGKE